MMWWVFFSGVAAGMAFVVVSLLLMTFIEELFKDRRRGALAQDWDRRHACG